MWYTTLSCACQLWLYSRESTRKESGKGQDVVTGRRRRNLDGPNAQWSSTKPLEVWLPRYHCTRLTAREGLFSFPSFLHFYHSLGAKSHHKRKVFPLRLLTSCSPLWTMPPSGCQHTYLLEMPTGQCSHATHLQRKPVWFRYLLKIAPGTIT